MSIKYSEATPSIVVLVEALTRECLIGELLELVGVGCHRFDKGVHIPRWTETPGASEMERAAFLIGEAICSAINFSTKLSGVSPRAWTWRQTHRGWVLEDAHRVPALLDLQPDKLTVRFTGADRRLRSRPRCRFPLLKAGGHPYGRF